MIVEAEAEEVEMVGKALGIEVGNTVKVSCSGFSFGLGTTGNILVVSGSVDETNTKKVDVEVGREMVAETVVDTGNSSDCQCIGRSFALNGSIVGVDYTGNGRVVGMNLALGSHPIG